MGVQFHFLRKIILLLLYFKYDEILDKLVGV